MPAVPNQPTFWRITERSMSNREKQYQFVFVFFFAKITSLMKNCIVSLYTRVRFRRFAKKTSFRLTKSSGRSVKAVILGYFRKIMRKFVENNQK